MKRHFVALGDSFTEGIGDTVDGLELHSAQDWIALWMQTANPDMKYTNLAERGQRAGEVRSQQMGRALKLEPDLVSIVTGANDCLRGPFSAEGLKAEMGLMFGAFESTGARIFTSVLPDFTSRLELPSLVGERVKRNLETANTIITELAERHRAILFDFRASGLEARGELWSEDGVHPNARGYFEIARAVALLIRANGIELEAQP
ncbi:MAG: SGNH/GDSL hydrolase family protein [Meiothermus sp.]|nr:SGNH/GDSL hydrolase family protein [Meiothermus sp.]